MDLKQKVAVSVSVLLVLLHLANGQQVRKLSKINVELYRLELLTLELVTSLASLI